MQAAITIEGKVLGQKRTLFGDWSIPLPPEWLAPGSRLRLRELITRVVGEEVEAFRQRQEQRRFVRILDQAEIEQGAARGKVDSGGRELKQEVDLGAAVETALQAFEDGLYFVFVDGQQIEALDGDVALRPDSRVTFVRLAALAGG